MKQYQDFFEKVKKFKTLQAQQKKEGLNDFNILTTLRKYDDEVYLHSAMIGALLNPKGLHYQGVTFLEIFLQELGLEEWGLDLKNTSVSVEYKDIDLYITDDIKHIIIENKIWAEDQPCQITKYINIIVEENKESFKGIKANDKLDENLIRVVYLTAQKKEVPHEHKVINGYISFAGSDKKLEECSQRAFTSSYVPAGLKNYHVKYKKVSYNKEIINWLNNSKKSTKENQNLMNLYQSINQYIDVVNMVIKNYKGNVMSLKEYILKENGLEFELLHEIIKDYNFMIENTKSTFLKYLEESLKEKYRDTYVENHIKIPISDNIILQTGIEKTKVFITLYKNGWATIDEADKQVVFSKLQKNKFSNFTWDKPSWNGYATLDIMSIESKEFLEVEKNLELMLNEIENVLAQLGKEHD